MSLLFYVIMWYRISRDTLPVTLWFIDLRYSGAVVCVVATFVAIHEGHYIRSGKKGGLQQ